MYTDTEGIVLRQTKTLNGRRMITLFTKRYGKISAGTSISEGSKTKSALALRPFSYSRYELFKTKDSYNINNAETLKSFFSIGEDIDKYMAASYAVELMDKLLPEEQSSPAMFNLIIKFLECIDTRKKAFGTLLCAYQLKLLSLSGCAPVLGSCVRTGAKEDLCFFSVADGGALCRTAVSPEEQLSPLLFTVSTDIIQAMQYMQTNPLAKLEKLALRPEIEDGIKRILRSYISHHLGIDHLRSEGLEI